MSSLCAVRGCVGWRLVEGEGVVEGTTIPSPARSGRGDRLWCFTWESVNQGVLSVTNRRHSSSWKLCYYAATHPVER